jgi:hypothetical protein
MPRNKSELALEIDQLKQQLQEREREQNYELGLFGGEFSFDRC